MGSEARGSGAPPEADFEALAGPLDSLASGNLDLLAPAPGQSPATDLAQARWPVDLLAMGKEEETRVSLAQPGVAGLDALRAMRRLRDIEASGRS